MNPVPPLIRIGARVAAIAVIASCGLPSPYDVLEDPPSISNLRYSPSRATQAPSGTVTISGTIDFSDPSADIDSIRIVSSGGVNMTVSTVNVLLGKTSGTYSTSFEVSVDKVGMFTFEVWATDLQGHSSNRLSGTIEVVVNDLAKTWTSVASNVGATLRRVVWTGTQFVAVGDGGTIVVSADGTTWTTRNSGTFNSLVGAAAFGSQLFAIGNPGTLVTSPDNGINWTAATLPVGPSIQLNALACSDKQCVAVGVDTLSSAGAPATVLRSSDGVNWTIGSAGRYLLTTTVWTGSQFLAGGGDLNQVNATPAVLRSTDGQSWSADSLALGSAYPGTSLKGFANAGASSDATIVAVGASGMLLSTGGAAWQSVTSNGLVGAAAVAWNGVHFLACENACSISRNDLDWVQNTPMPTSAVVRDLAWGGPGSGRWIAVGDNGAILASP